MLYPAARGVSPSALSFSIKRCKLRLRASEPPTPSVTTASPGSRYILEVQELQSPDPRIASFIPGRSNLQPQTLRPLTIEFTHSDSRITSCTLERYDLQSYVSRPPAPNIIASTPRRHGLQTQTLQPPVQTIKHPNPGVTTSTSRRYDFQPRRYNL